MYVARNVPNSIFPLAENVLHFESKIENFLSKIKFCLSLTALAHLLKIERFQTLKYTQTSSSMTWLCSPAERRFPFVRIVHQTHKY